MKAYLLSGILLIIYSNVTFSQRYGGVCISDTHAIADESAMLHLASKNKGVVLPILTLSERDAISPLEPGLTIYVKDGSTSGFQYWTGKKWIRLAVARTDKPSMIAPMGGIIMYHGSFDNFDINGKGFPGTEMEGWQLCNGKNKSPNLSGKFIVGGGDEDELTTQNIKDPNYSKVGKQKIISNTYTISEANMPKHTHKVDSMVTIIHNHSHTLSSYNEYDVGINRRDHEIYDNNEHIHSYPTRDEGSRKKGELSRKSLKDNERQEKKNERTATVTGKINLDEISVKDAKTTDGRVPDVFFTVNDNVMKKYEGKKVTLDRRPKYYIVAFIIRIDENDNENYGIVHPINYIIK